MANNKIGFAYYSADTDRFQDIRIKRLKKEFGCEGYAVYEYALNEVYRVKGCFLEWDEETAFDISDYFSLSEKTVNSIVNYCIEIGLFDRELFYTKGVLSSKSIQRRYLEMCKRAKRFQNIIPEEYDIIREESPKLPEESEIIPPKTPIPLRSYKVKESKVKKEIKEIFPPPEINPDFLDKSLEDCFSELINCVSWYEIICMNNHIAPDKFKELLKQFFRKLQDEGETKKNVKDAKSHFSRWLKIELKTQNKDGADRNASQQTKKRNLIGEFNALANGEKRSPTDNEILNF